MRAPSHVSSVNRSSEGCLCQAQANPAYCNASLLAESYYVHLRRVGSVAFVLVDDAVSEYNVVLEAIVGQSGRNVALPVTLNR